MSEAEGLKRATIAKNFTGPHVRKAEGAAKFHVGPIHSSVAGRTDHLPIHVESGSYVIPADIISGWGEGNTIAGFKHARRVFGGMPRGQGREPYGHKGGPYGGGEHAYGQGSTPYGMAEGGEAQGVPIVAAGGEYVLSPEQCRRVGDGDIDRGHRVLDRFVKESRKQLIKTLKHLAPPKKD